MIYIGCPRYCYKIFYPIINALSLELNDLNFPSSIIIFEDGKCSLQQSLLILFGAQHLINLEDTISSNTVILYNLEQLIWKRWDPLLDRLKSIHQIWDYSSQNIHYLSIHYPHISTHHVPIGYSPHFNNTSQNNTSQNNKIGFVGNLSERRIKILENLKQQHEITILNHHYFQQLQDSLENIDTILNIHFHPDNSILEVVRILPLLCQHKKIISEFSNDPELDKMFSGIISFVNFNNLSPSSLFPILQKPFPSHAFSQFKHHYNWSSLLLSPLSKIQFKDLPKKESVAVATLHCNNRESIFEVIHSFASQTTFRDFTWVVFSQGCTSTHNQEIKDVMDMYCIKYVFVVATENLGWSRGMNGLYKYLIEWGKFTYILHLEDDWICDETTTVAPYQDWFEQCCIYLHLHSNVSTLFLRKYTSKKDKEMYGWTKHIHYMCFQHQNAFNYESKIKTQPKQKFNSLTFRQIPEFLYTANPTIFRLEDYVKKGVFPFPEFTDATQKQKQWETTTMLDAPQWGFAEGLAMEKIRDLICMNVNDGFFYHRN